jgi:hypothetical protein
MNKFTPKDFLSRLGIARAVLIAGALLMMGLAQSAKADTLTFASIDTSTSPFYVDLSTTNYLAQYGITMTGVTAGTQVDVLCANASYNTSCTSGTGALSAPPGTPNILYQQGSDGPESYTLNFSTPLSSLSFYTAGQGSGNLIGGWSATAYDGNTVVSSVPDPGYSIGFPGEAPQLYALTGPGITSVTFSGNCGSCGVYGDSIGDLSSPDLHLVSTPEPSTSSLLFGAGLLGLLGLAARGKRYAPPASC